MANVYQFDDESYEDIKAKRFSDLPDAVDEGDRLKNDLGHFVESISDLIVGKQKSKLNKRGYVLLVSGTWGAGKSTATWVTINEIKNKVKDTTKIDTIEIIDRSLLPFGGASESITTFLNSFAQTLWDKNLLDIRTDIKQFILEITPDSETTYHLSAALGPLGFSKPFSKNTPSVSIEKLTKKFQRLVKLERTIVIVLDDLDRLRPEEIIDILRMVEKLRRLPRLMVVLPVFKKIITDAFEQDLKLSPSNAATFLRKLSDAEVFIDNTIEDLKRTFLTYFTDDINNEFGIVGEKYNLSVSELCWFILLHCLIIRESIAEIRDAPNPNDAADRQGRVFDPSSSRYLSSLRDVLIESVRANSNAPYPVQFLDNQNKEVFVPVGNYYNDIREMQVSTPSRLETLLNYDDINKAVTTDPNIVSTVATQPNPSMTFDQAAQDKSSNPIFIEVLLPLLKSTKTEVVLTDNYKLRDIKILARMIQGDPRFEANDEPLHTLFDIVSENFSRFRF